MSIPDELKGCPLFYEMYEKEIEKIVKRGLVGTYQPGEVIVADGVEGDEIFVVLDGRLVVQKKTPAGVIEIAPLVKGDVFGELVLLDEKIRSADIVSIEVSDVLELSYSQIFSLYEKEPNIFGVLMLNVSRLLAKRLRATNKIIVELRKEKSSEL
ncbi:MAG: cyclic nucleotide-binding domain-containing protein [Oligoflexales bacterium]|nr:cyclic nucleotide-binding domain-containing protein [Oligoflexales bacterium]